MSTLLGCTQATPTVPESQQFCRTFGEVASGAWLPEQPATPVHDTELAPILELSLQPVARDPALGTLTLRGSAGDAHDYLVVVASSGGTSEPPGSLVLLGMAVDPQGTPQAEIVHVLWSGFSSTERLRVGGAAWLGSDPITLWRQVSR